MSAGGCVGDQSREESLFGLGASSRTGGAQCKGVFRAGEEGGVVGREGSWWGQGITCEVFALGDIGWYEGSKSAVLRLSVGLFEDEDVAVDRVAQRKGGKGTEESIPDWMRALGRKCR